jgi:hypothetical protein
MGMKEDGRVGGFNGDGNEGRWVGGWVGGWMRERRVYKRASNRNFKLEARLYTLLTN